MHTGFFARITKLGGKLAMFPTAHLTISPSRKPYGAKFYIKHLLAELTDGRC